MLQEGLYLTMVEKTQSLDIDISIISLSDLSEEEKDCILSFSCGNKSLDNFFHKEVFLCMKHHYLAAYCAKEKLSGDIVAIFTLANDAVIIDSEDDKKDFIEETCSQISEEYIPTFENQTSYPAINIGHLGVRKDWQSKGIGLQIIDFVVYTFCHYKMAGCQFITVDSLNNPRTNKFYTRNYFFYQTNSDLSSLTRRMYKPLQIFKDDI